MKNNTVTLHRVLRASPEKVFRAFADPIATSSWFPPYGFLCQVQEMDFKEGGQFRMSFINFSTGNAQAFGGVYLEIQPDAFIKYTDSFDDPALPGEITTSIRLNAVSVGTELEIEQVGIPDVIPADMCYLGWQECMDKLKRLVEPEYQTHNSSVMGVNRLKENHWSAAALPVNRKSKYLDIWDYLNDKITGG